MRTFTKGITKTDFVKEIKWHQAQDKIIQGTYEEGSNGDFRGCAVGCSIHSINRLRGTNYEKGEHSVYESELGIPEWLARLEDTIFEGLPIDKAKKWPLRFSQSIPVGVDLEPVKWKFAAFILAENIERVLTLDIADDLKKQVVDSIRGVLAVTEVAIKTGEWDESAAWSAESAVWSAGSAVWSAESAARSAESAGSAVWSAESAARSAESAVWSARSAAGSAGSAESAVWSARSAAGSAGSAAWSARSAAESAAESAGSAVWSAGSAARSAESAAWSARSAAYEQYADKLIKLIKLTAK